ncbi:MAG: nitroreductase family protein [Theionarchaea archaeon]|nr:nitroreductase family protein [Theionarchaea archaeon]
MNVGEAIVTRRSVRDYQEKPVPDEVLVDILETAKWAPSPVNSQPWRFIVIRDREILTRVMAHAKYGSHLSEVPMAIAVIATDVETFHWFNEIEENKYAAAVVATSIMLAAWEKGVGTGWVSVDRKEINDILDVPREYTVVAVIAMGYPVRVEPHSDADRRPLDMMVFSGKYGERFPRIDEEWVEEHMKK